MQEARDEACGDFKWTADHVEAGEGKFGILRGGLLSKTFCNMGDKCYMSRSIITRYTYVAIRKTRF